MYCDASQRDEKRDEYGLRIEKEKKLVPPRQGSLTDVKAESKDRLVASEFGIQPAPLFLSSLSLTYLTLPAGLTSSQTASTSSNSSSFPKSVIRSSQT
jgi:hypothetical protein